MGEKRGRDSNFELMRIVAMLMIIAGHFVYQSNFFEKTSGINWMIGNLIGNNSKIAVNMFLILGVWFMIDTEFKARRVIKLYCQVWFWTVPISIAVIMLGFHPSIKDIFRSVFPFVGKGVWFASAYISLLLISPWLHEIIIQKRNSVKKLLIVMTGLISVWVTLWSFDRIENEWLDIMVWFSYIYILVAYYRLYLANEINYNKWAVLIISIIMYLALVGTYSYSLLYADQGGMRVINKVTWACLDDYKTFPNLLISCGLVYFFYKIDIGVNKYINFLSAGAFSVYIVHQTPTFIHILWFNIYCVDAWINTSFVLFYTGVVIMSCYLVIAIIDYFRRKYIEKYIIESRAIIYIENQIDRFYKW